MPCEDEMSISYDAVSKSVTVFFRGEKTILDGPYQTREAGMEAGKKFCRSKGWAG